MLKTYKASINGIDHTFQLSDEDAVKRGLDPAKDSVEDAPAAVSPLDFAEPSTDGQDVEATPAVDAKARAVDNKSRAVDNK